MDSLHVGFLAAILTTIAYIPQTIKTMHSGHTRDLSLPMYILVTTGSFSWSIYGFLTQDYPILLANIVVLLTVSFTLYFIIKDRFVKKPKNKKK
jgi:MtN3 and saliva related transmembrane protein